MFRTILKSLFQKNKKSSVSSNYHIDTPEEIRKQISNMTRCDKCHFLIFNNYWGNVQIDNEKLCPTCGTVALNNTTKEVVTL